MNVLDRWIPGRVERRVEKISNRCTDRQLAHGQKEEQINGNLDEWLVN